MASEHPDSADVEIVPMILDHLPEVMSIEAESFAAPAGADLWRREIESPLAMNLSARTAPAMDSRVVGYIHCWAAAGELQVNSIAVSRPYRRQGIARRLLKAMMDRAAEEGMVLATLEVRASNEAAIGLYESLGFVVKGRRRGYYEREGEDALLMEAPLSKDEGSIRCTEER